LRDVSYFKKIKRNYIALTKLIIYLQQNCIKQIYKKRENNLI
jgi:hypothetical protein